VLTLLVTAALLATIPLDHFLPDLRYTLHVYSLQPMVNPPANTGIHGVLYYTPFGVHTFFWVLMGAVATTVVALREPRSEAATPEAAGVAVGPGERFARLLRNDDWYVPFLLTALFVQLKTYDMVVLGPLVAGLFAAESCRGLYYAPGLIAACRTSLVSALIQRVTLGAVDPWPAHVATAGIVWVAVTHWVLKRRRAGPAGRE
jgi:hypothetical protein